MNVEQSVEWKLAGEIEVLGKKTCPRVTLSTTNFTWPDLGSNPFRRGGKPATNSLSYGTASAPWLLSRNLLHFWTMLYQVVGLCGIETESCVSCWIVIAQWMIRNGGWICTRFVRNVIYLAWIWFHASAIRIGAVYLKMKFCKSVFVSYMKWTWYKNIFHRSSTSYYSLINVRRNSSLI
jgi:hypothetical protein